MALTVTHAAAVPEDAALVAVGVRSDHLEEDADGADLPLLGAQGFEGKVGQTALVGGQPMRLMVGPGPVGRPRARRAPPGRRGDREGGPA